MSKKTNVGKWILIGVSKQDRDIIYSKVRGRAKTILVRKHKKEYDRLLKKEHEKEFDYYTNLKNE